jgi:hypothetical protein
MTTGYTAAFEDSKTYSFEQFVWGCARAFDMGCRDNDGLSPLHRKPVIAYDSARLAQCRRDLAALTKISDKALQTKIDAEYKRELRRWVQGNEKSKDLDLRYAKMRERVQAWSATSKDQTVASNLEALKKFMLGQLDTHKSYRPSKPKKRTIGSYRKAHLRYLREDIRQSEKNIQESINRTQEVNLFFQELNTSVPRPKESK